MVKIIILRHGESEWNHENKFCGWIDIPLSEKGKQEADHAGELILKAKLKPIAMYTSKLTRTNQTGYIILNKLNRLWCDSFKSWKLNERHYGSFQGQDKTKIFQELGKDKYDYIRRDYNGRPPPVVGDDSCIDERYDDGRTSADELPKAESLKNVSERFIPYFKEEIFAKNYKQCLKDEQRAILIVMHGSPVRAFIKHFTNVSEKDISKINIPTGIPIIFELDENMEVIGDYYYLDKEAAERGIKKVSNEGRAK
ncbi:phosphoglycerate mutase 1 [[Candida] railenensis]|uniref:Phosphoglycerate mutase n=1 Tax=[Candida] railenensis TaxID=45579 RepID=A0A9P0W0N1_9ASCO|nr:phosphoglycerate mutase 1 [[Candida] railenensis]